MYIEYDCYLDAAIAQLVQWVKDNTVKGETAPRFNLEEGLIMVVDGRRSGLEDLVLLNYHPTASFRRASEWKDIERVARGLVFEKGTGRLIARPYIKFHNYGELADDALIEDRDIDRISYKEDGSLGICFYYNGLWWVSTHGSLNSDQGVKGTEILRTKQTQFMNTKFTYMAEIIYPENRIVTNYGDMTDLILLDVIPIGTCTSVDSGHGKFLIKQGVFADSQKDWIVDDTNVIQSILNFCENQPDFNFEGFVVTLTNGRKVKFKTKEYLSVHRCRFAVSLSKVKELMLTSPETLIQWKETLPNEFFEDVDGMIKVLTEYANHGFDTVIKSVKEIYANKGIEAGGNVKEISRQIYMDVNQLPTHLRGAAWLVVKGVDDARIYQNILETFET